jgi:hypothetical protein
MQAHGAANFAYSLSQDEEGWRWSIYDQDGVTVAGGADPCRTAAQAAVDLALRRVQTWGESALVEFPSWGGTAKRGRELIARS